MTITCKVCKKAHDVNISGVQLRAIHEGNHVQDVAPHLSADDRELLISGICGTCFDKMFK